MATPQNERARTGPAMARSAANPARSGKRRVAWVVLVGIVPIIVAVFAVGIALQVIGVPVWQTTLRLATQQGGSKALSQVQASQQKNAAAKRKVQQLQGEEQKLRSELSAANSRVKSLQAKNDTLQKQLQVAHNDLSSGQQEAKILAQMDTQSAAQVLQKLGVDESGWIVTAMGPDVSGPILQEVPTAFASKVLQKAAIDHMSATKEANASSNSTKP